MISSTPRCCLVCVGSELLRGKINTHASFIAGRLASIGLELNGERTCRDSLDDLTDAIRSAIDSLAIVLVTGGLGPTFDDLTREAASEATGRPLKFSPAILRDITRKFSRARLTRMPPANRRQADVLEGAVSIPNSVGTAPGQWLDLPRGVLILLPGPPSELAPMMDTFVIPRLRKQFPAAPQAEAHLHFIGVPESEIDRKVRPIIARAQGADFTILAQPGLVDLDIFITSSSIRKAKNSLERLVRAIQRKTSSSFYGRDAIDRPEKEIMRRFLSKGETLALAESCTGGLIAKSLTDIPGSSNYFLGAIVSYSDAVKRAQLGVAREILAREGAVSKEAAEAMARGAREALGSTWALSVTGLAGPSGGTLRKPVGLVYICIAGPRGTRTVRFQFRGDRDSVRRRTLVAALDALRRI